MLKRPTEVVLRHFDVLFSTFQRRFWVSAVNGYACRDQNIELLDHLRAKYPANFDVTEAAVDLIDFKMNRKLQAKEHLLYLLKLCCLCITPVSPVYPGVIVGSINTSGNQDRFTDVFLPLQSYLSGVPVSVALCGNDANLVSFSLLSAFLGRLPSLRVTIHGNS